MRIGVALLAASASTHAATLLVPAYFSPTDDPADWARLTAAASQVSVTAIFNPDSGPGNAQDPDYTSALTAFRAAGGKAVAYVHTQNADGSLRNLATVEAEVDKYRSFYSFDGVFVDEMTDDTKTGHLNFYTKLYNYIKADSAAYTVVGNPGTGVPSQYAAVADVLVTYEDVAVNYASSAPMSWAQSRPAADFAHIVYESPSASLTATLAEAAAQNVGNVFVTDDGLDGNPYDSLPSYWTAEVNAVAAPEPACGVMLVAMAMAGRQSRRAARARDWQEIS